MLEILSELRTKDKTVMLMFASNSILLAGSISTLIIFKNSYFTSLLLLISLFVLCVYATSSNKRNLTLSREVKLWLGSLFSYVGLWIGSILYSGDFTPSYFERPLKLLAGAVILINLAAYGAHRMALPIGAAISILLVFTSHFILNSGGLNGRIGLGLNPNSFGFVVSGTSLLLVSYALIYKNLSIRLFFLCIGIAGITASFASGSRGLLLIYAFYGFSLILIYWRSMKIKPALGLLVSVFFIATALNLTEFNSSTLSRTVNQDSIFFKIFTDEEIDLDSGPDSVRASMYVVAAHTYKNNLVIGAGNNIQKIITDYKDQNPEKKLAWNKMSNHSSFHNVYLDAAARMGSLGLISLLLMLALAFIASNHKSLVIAPLSVVVGGGLFDSPFAGSQYLVFFAITIPAILILGKHERFIEADSL